MRLLRIEQNGGLSLVEYVGRDIPPYAILSHTWGPDQHELTFQDVVEGTGETKPGYQKLLFCREQATRDGLQFFWADTCCIDKSSSAELSEAINSMFRWYREAKRCYAYLSDVSFCGSPEDNGSTEQSWKQDFLNSRWFTRGWTLQELLASTTLDFFSKEGKWLGDRISLAREINDITKISPQAFEGIPLSYFNVDERLSWAKTRNTMREEDAAYSLLGIFDVNLPLIYGEGRKRAFFRLHREIKESQKLELYGLDTPRVPNTGISSSPSVITYNGKIYCFHQGGWNNGELWYNVFDGAWAGDVRIRNTGMSASPSAIVYHKKVYCFHQGFGNNGELWYNVFDGIWAGDVRVSNITIAAGPSAIVYNDKIYVFHQGSRQDSQLWYTVFDGTSWSDDIHVPKTGMSSGPSAIVYDGKIYCFHQGGGGNGELWFNVFDGVDWSGDVRVPNTGMSSGPSAIVHNGEIYCFHQGHSENGELWYNVFNGVDWVGDFRIPNTGMSSGPSSVVYDNKIYCFHQDYRTKGELQYNVFNGRHWES